VHEAFAAADTDGDGFLSETELAAFASLAEWVSDPLAAAAKTATAARTTTGLAAKSAGQVSKQVRVLCSIGKLFLFVVFFCLPWFTGAARTTTALAAKAAGEVSKQVRVFHSIGCRLMSSKQSRFHYYRVNPKP